jgi:hypothetical protein
MSSLSTVGYGFHTGTMNCLGDAKAGAYRYGLIVLDYRHEGASVQDIRHPIVEAATKKMSVVIADGYGWGAGR